MGSRLSIAFHAVSLNIFTRTFLDALLPAQGADLIPETLLVLGGIRGSRGLIHFEQ